MADLKFTRLLILPFKDYIAALRSCFRMYSLVNTTVLVLAFVFSWWLYVPTHELGHAFGCMIGGGSVTRLEVSPMYGASLLEKIFPFVSVGPEYAGQLTEFDTHGSDLVYLLTVFFPFMLTIILGVPLVESAASYKSRPLISCLKFGFGMPIAYTPFISITGDYYEMGSIIVSRFVAVRSPDFRVEIWRSDDLFKLIEELFIAGKSTGVGDLFGVLISFLLGLFLCFITYWVGVLWSRLVLRI